MFRFLYSNQLSGTIPSSIGNLTQLRELYVHSCFRISPTMSHQTNSSTQTSLFLCVVMSRQLDTNQLSGTIPSSIGNLAQLQWLYVHYGFQFRQQTHIKTNSFNPNFSIFVCDYVQISFHESIEWSDPFIDRQSCPTWLLVCSFFLQFRQQTHIKTNSFNPNFSIFAFDYVQISS